jgi:hypothetical protein
MKKKRITSAKAMRQKEPFMIKTDMSIVVKEAVSERQRVVRPVGRSTTNI